MSSERQRPAHLATVGWTVAVLVLVLVNTGGNVVLAVALAAVVGVISWRIDKARTGSPD